MLLHPNFGVHDPILNQFDQYFQVGWNRQLVIHVLAVGSSIATDSGFCTMKLPRIWTIPNPSTPGFLAWPNIYTCLNIFFHWLVRSKIFPENCFCCFVGRHLALIQLIWSNEYPTLKIESVCVPRIFKQRPLHHPFWKSDC